MGLKDTYTKETLKHFLHCGFALHWTFCFTVYDACVCRLTDATVPFLLGLSKGRCTVNINAAFSISLTLVIAGKKKTTFLGVLHSLSTPSPMLLQGFETCIGLERKPAGPAVIQICSVRLWEQKGQPRLFVGEKIWVRRGNSHNVSHIRLQALLHFSLRYPLLILYKCALRFSSGDQSFKC